MAKAEYAKMNSFTLTKYDTKPKEDYTLQNNGHTLHVGFAANFFKVSGGGLEGTYTTVQFHLHWGENKDEGSEHTMDNKAYPAEVSK